MNDVELTIQRLRILFFVFIHFFNWSARLVDQKPIAIVQKRFRTANSIYNVIWIAFNHHESSVIDFSEMVCIQKW